MIVLKASQRLVVFFVDVETVFNRSHPVGQPETDGVEANGEFPRTHGEGFPGFEEFGGDVPQ